jgi:hypothetical protein
MVFAPGSCERAKIVAPHRTHPEQAGVTLPQACRDESGGEAIRSDAGARESARKPAGE